MPIKSQVGKESVLLYSAVVDFDESSNCSEYTNTFGVHCVHICKVCKMCKVLIPITLITKPIKQFLSSHAALAGCTQCILYKSTSASTCTFTVLFAKFEWSRATKMVKTQT